MKKSTSVNLEESTWKEINDYKDKLDLSSRNDALERIIQEWRMLWMFFNKDVVVSSAQGINQNDNKDILIEEKKEEEQSDSIGNSVKDVFNNMPD